MGVVLVHLINKRVVILALIVLRDMLMPETISRGSLRTKVHDHLNKIISKTQTLEASVVEMQ